jgi:hypothetical protein
VSKNSELASEPASRRVGRRPWQFGLRTAFLITAAIAAWTAVFVNRRESEQLRTRIQTIRPLARELVVDDPDQTAVVKLDEMWYDENGWDLYLPAGQYRVCLATRGIDRDGKAQAKASAPIAPGRHRLTFEQTQNAEARRLVIQNDGARLLETVEDYDKKSFSGWSSHGVFTTSIQRPADEPLFLFRRQYFVPRTDGSSSVTEDPSDGVLIWIERTGP